MSDQTDTTLALAHLAILKDAEVMANQRFEAEFGIDSESAWRPGRFKAPPGERRKAFASGRIFRADPVASDKGGLCLSIEQSALESIDPDNNPIYKDRKKDPDVALAYDNAIEIYNKRLADLHRIGMESIHQSIIRNQTVFIGVILGEARGGRNYFDRFLESEQTFEQTRLF